MDKKESIEIPFGAFDSELKGWEYTIPEGMEARIEGNKIIVKPKESEDEKIRNRIIDYLKQDIEEYPERKKRIEDMLAWLEKQGEQKSFNDTQEYLKGVHRVQGYEDLTEYEKVFDRIADTYAHNKNKEGYNKPSYTKERAAEMLHWAKKELGLLENDNSAKACNVEPKFKVGDWVVYNDDICQIVKREEGCNKLVTNFGIEKELVNERNLSTARLWTIQDAKDGDVLVNKYGSVFICAGFENDERVTVNDYCYITVSDHKFCIEDHETGSWYYVKELSPATKEQRDLLFQKMKEAGYEWNAEKKELRKIEQKPAWSKEDETRFESTLHRMEIVGNGCAFGQLKDDIAWLKSLKERCIWKPSDGQMVAFKRTIDNLPHHEALYSLYIDLKKLKE